MLLQFVKAGPVVERAVFEARDDVGQGTAGGFEVTLHADVELAVARETFGVDDGAANRGGGNSGCDMRRSRGCGGEEQFTLIGRG